MSNKNKESQYDLSDYPQQYQATILSRVLSEEEMDELTERYRSARLRRRQYYPSETDVQMMRQLGRGEVTAEELQKKWKHKHITSTHQRIGVLYKHMIKNNLPLT